ncbi:hypothetical protein AeRB84_020459 [Aphanomyces euteiches]|nr:hypothetical protein AeRB84_020459 [Aphanomyces euteiches]
MEGRLSHLFFVSHEVLDVFKANYDIIMMDCTYKTNKFGMPLLNFIGVSGMNTILHLAHCFMAGESTDDYTWALTTLKECLSSHAILSPSVILVDRDLALLNALDTSFPNVPTLLCLWYVVKANTATTEVPENWITIFKGEVKKLVADPKYKTDNLLVYMGQCISETARIAWTTTGHVGTDVNLYCAGPSVFTRRCDGNHDNTHVNEIMTNYLNLDLQPITLKLRGFKPNDDKTAPPPVTPSPMNAPTTKAP